MGHGGLQQPQAQRASKVEESIGRVGAGVLPLPPYSSDYDPIEELWSKLKGQLRRIAVQVQENVYNTGRETLDSGTLHDILGWFNHTGLYATHA
jgi:transposase